MKIIINNFIGQNLQKKHFKFVNNMKNEKIWFYVTNGRHNSLLFIKEKIILQEVFGF